MPLRDGTQRVPQGKIPTKIRLLKFARSRPPIVRSERRHAFGREAVCQSFCLDEVVPEDHRVREIAAVLDLSWVYAEIAPYYARIGRPSIDPVLMIRMLIVGYVFAIRSERAICREVQVNLAYRTPSTPKGRCGIRSTVCAIPPGPALSARVALTNGAGWEWRGSRSITCCVAARFAPGFMYLVRSRASVS
jgi:hypothetical protein